MLDRLHSWLRALADRRAPAHLRRAHWGEDVACRHLRQEGYRIVARNFRARSGKGELDIVAWDGEWLAIVEVKTRGTDRFGAPREAVNRDKQRVLIRTAHEYARRSRVEPERIRYDIVSVIPTASEPRIELDRGAFTELQVYPGNVGR